VLIAVVKLLKGSIRPFSSFEPEVASIPLGSSIAGDDITLLTLVLVVLADCGSGDSEENEVIYPFGDGPDPFGSEYVRACICKIAEDTG